MQKTIRVAKCLFHETIYIHKIIVFYLLLFTRAPGAEAGQKPHWQLLKFQVTSPAGWGQAVAFGSFSASQEASLVPAVPPNLLEARQWQQGAVGHRKGTPGPCLPWEPARGPGGMVNL